MGRERARALSPCVEEDTETGRSDDGSEVEVPSRVTRCRDAVGWWWSGLRARWRLDFGGWARDALECVGATLVVVWLVLRYYRINHENSPSTLQG
jgi:hypothetical protein